MDIYLQQLTNTVSLGGHEIEFSTSAEHVGILCSLEGIMPNILSSHSAHTRAIMSVLPISLAYKPQRKPCCQSVHSEAIWHPSPSLLPAFTCPFGLCCPPPPQSHSPETLAPPSSYSRMWCSLPCWQPASHRYHSPDFIILCEPCELSVLAIWQAVWVEWKKRAVYTCM